MRKMYYDQNTLKNEPQSLVLSLVCHTRSLMLISDCDCDCASALDCEVEGWLRASRQQVVTVLEVGGGGRRG